jgi:ABC-type glycerol-3-phosphate transport system substrate-binding protein
MRKASVLAVIALLIAACGGASTGGGSPAPAATTEADLDITGPVTITLWHALTSDPQKGALEAAVKKFNETNGKGITVQAVVQGNYTQLYQKTLGAIQAGACPSSGTRTSRSWPTTPRPTSWSTSTRT